MLKKSLIFALALYAVDVSSADLKPLNLSKPIFDGDGNYQKDFVLKSLVGKSPEFVFSKLGRKLNPREKNPAGFSRWSSRKCEKSGETLATYKLVVVDSRVVLDGRHAFSFQADFYKTTPSSPWVCWDAFYKLLPKGVDWHKQQREFDAKEN